MPVEGGAGVHDPPEEACSPMGQQVVALLDGLRRRSRRASAGECCARRYAHRVEPIDTLALGIDLKLVPTAEGGRATPLLGGHEVGHRFTYRPNWGLPGWPDGEQTAAPVLGFSRSNIAPGESARAIIVPLFVELVRWSDVHDGDELRMYEGSRICGTARVCWVKRATCPMPADEQEMLLPWLL